MGYKYLNSLLVYLSCGIQDSLLAGANQNVALVIKFQMPFGWAWGAIYISLVNKGEC